MAVARMVRHGPEQIPIKVTDCLCPDGKRRSVRITAQPDTFFTTPAAVKCRGKTVSGWVSHCTTHTCRCGHTWTNGWLSRCPKCGGDDSQFESQDDMEFFPSLGSKNGAMFQEKGATS